MKKFSRRIFLSSAAASVTAFTVVPRHVLGGAGATPPSEKLNIACIGVGGKDFDDVRERMGDPAVSAVSR